MHYHSSTLFDINEIRKQFISDIGVGNAKDIQKRRLDRFLDILCANLHTLPEYLNSSGKITNGAFGYDTYTLNAVVTFCMGLDIDLKHVAFRLLDDHFHLPVKTRINALTCLFNRKHDLFNIGSLLAFDCRALMVSPEHVQWLFEAIEKDDKTCSLLLQGANIVHMKNNNVTAA